MCVKFRDGFVVLKPILAYLFSMDVSGRGKAPSPWLRPQFWMGRVGNGGAGALGVCFYVCRVTLSPEEAQAKDNF